MKVAAVNWDKNKINELISGREIISLIKNYSAAAEKKGINLIVFPAYTGVLYSLLKKDDVILKNAINTIDSQDFINSIKEISCNKNLIICPGSVWEKYKGKIYHTSYIIQNGKIKLKQREIYLASWEKELNLERYKKLHLTDINGWRTGIILSTDVFYPRISRQMALRGAELILSPVGFVGEKNPARQISGMWNQVQQNLFFAVESGFNGRLIDRFLWGNSFIHAPLEMTEEDNGLPVKSCNEKSLIWLELDKNKRRDAIKRFNVLKQLNCKLYSKYL